MRHLIALILLLGGIAALVGCTTPARAPVSERKPPAPVDKPATSVATKPAASVPSAKQPDWRPSTYTVQKGDTLYGIALEHGFDYTELAAWNNIPAPYTIHIGQVLRLTPSEASTSAPLKAAAPVPAQPLPAPAAAASPPVKTGPKALKEAYASPSAPQPDPPKPVAAAKAEPPKEPPSVASTRTGAETMEEDAVDWGWPAQGKIVTNFSENGGSRGIAISGTMGQAVVAAGGGKVVHIGSTLRGYGKLVIIKHNKSFFSVYAHNSEILVKEGQSVVKGQKIAEMGDTDADQVKLHFEIRRLGKPVDPLRYLPNDRAS